MQNNGMKFDGDKIKTELLYKDFVAELEEIAGVLTFGANKYEPRSWQTVPNGFERYYAALIRHTNARLKGELIDPESGKSHLSHAACCLLFMMGLDSAEEEHEEPVDITEAMGINTLMEGPMSQQPRTNFDGHFKFKLNDSDTIKELQDLKYKPKIQVGDTVKVTNAEGYILKDLDAPRKVLDITEHWVYVEPLGEACGDLLFKPESLEKL